MVHEDGMTDQRTAEVTIEEFEHLAKDGSGFLDIYNFVTEEIAHGHARMRLEFREHHVRSGGTMAGPSMMALADFAAYAALMGAIGPVQMAVTSSLSINFLRRPEAADMVAEARIVSSTRRLAFSEVDLYSAGETAPIAHITATYAIPKIKA